VRFTIWKISLEGCQQGIVSNKWRDSDLQALAREAESLNFLREWKYSLEGERGFGNYEYDKLIKADRTRFPDMLRGMLSPGTVASASSSAIWFVAPRGWVRYNQVEYNRLIDLDLEDIDERNERIAPAFSRVQSRIEERSDSPLWDWYYKLGSASGGIRFQASKRAFMLHSNLQQFRILCAAAQYHHVRGELPETLDALVPTYLKAVPRDIIDGQPMRYRRTKEGGCILWSIGIDRIDDRGVERVPGKGSNNGDWIVEIPAILPKQP
jgi:hypothetical protein